MKSDPLSLGEAENLGEPVNSPPDDFCPTPVRGGGLFFVSRKEPASCGAGDSDIYFARLNPARGWSEGEHLGSAEEGPNSTLDEMGPSYLEVAGEALLYFSSGPDIYASERLPDGSFGPARAITQLNSPASDIQPNVRQDGREIVFASNRPSSATDTITDQNIWFSTRETVDQPWSTPGIIGDAVNTAGQNETRASFSWDAARLCFGRSPFPTGAKLTSTPPPARRSQGAGNDETHRAGGIRVRRRVLDRPSRRRAPTPSSSRMTA